MTIPAENLQSSALEMNDLLTNLGIDPQQVLVFSTPAFRTELNKILPWLAAEQPDIFNAYQQTQGARAALRLILPLMLLRSSVHEPGRALFAGLYAIGGSTPMTRERYWRVLAYIEMKKIQHEGGFTEESDRSSCLWFELLPTGFYDQWKGS